MGQRTQQAKQQAALGYAVGLDDLASSLDFKKRWDDYTAAVAEAQQKARNKSGILSFVRTAVFFATAVFAPFAAHWANALLSTSVAGVGGMAADEMVGGVPKPKAPVMKASRFNKSRNIERQQELEGAYTQLHSDIDKMEDDMNKAHWMQPLNLAISFYGPKMIQKATTATTAATASSPTVGVEGTTALTPEGAPVSSANTIGGTKAWKDLVTTAGMYGVGMTGAQNVIASYMPGLSTEYSAIQPRGTGHDYSTVQDNTRVDYTDVAATLDRIAPSVDASGLPQLDSHSSLDTPAWESEVDYLDYLDEITDDLTL